MSPRRVWHLCHLPYVFKNSSKKTFPFNFQLSDNNSVFFFTFCCNIVEPEGTPLRLGVPWPFIGHPADERWRELTGRTCRLWSTFDCWVCLVNWVLSRFWTSLQHLHVFRFLWATIASFRYTSGGLIRIYPVYLRTVLIKARPCTQYRMQISNIFTVKFIFCPSKANSWRLSYCNGNAPKQSITPFVPAFRRRSHPPVFPWGMGTAKRRLLLY